jgi:hypothetical protein
LETPGENEKAWVTIEENQYNRFPEISMEEGRDMMFKHESLDTLR